MKKHVVPIKSVLAVLLASSVLTGCSGESLRAMVEELQPIQPGKTISEDSAWINSDIDGALDENTIVSVKDDFHTAVNKEWILKQTLDEESNNFNSFLNCEDVLRQQKLAILNSDDSDSTALNENPAGLEEAQLQHNEAIVSEFAKIAGDWEERNTMGMNSILPYLDAITSIQTLEDMNAYLMNDNHMNFTRIYPIEMNVSIPFVDKTQYTVSIAPLGANPTAESNYSPPLTLENADEYSKITSDGIFRKEAMNQKITYLLNRLGWSSGDINKTLVNCYTFEARLANANDPNIGLDDINNMYTYQELKNMQGNYPLTEILSSLNLDDSKSFTVWDVSYVKSMGKIYSSAHLEEMKAYYLVHTLDSAMVLLDRECYDKFQASRMTTVEDKNSLDENESREEKEISIILDQFVTRYMAGPMDSVYVSRYCSKGQKEELSELTEDIVDYYRDMLLETEWLSDETQTHAVEKLNSMKKKILYPDTFPDYSSFNIQQGDTLVDIVANLKDLKLNQNAAKVNQPVDFQEWDLDTFPTTQANAFYSPLDNSINIMSGLLADGFFYSKDAAYEEVLGKIGTVIGHEITHGFDQNGSQYDKDGQHRDWWTYKDYEAFQKRISKMIIFYQSIIPYPGGASYTNDVSSEATADMGGVKCMLGIAAQKEDFDYEKFFISYATIWKTKCSLMMEQRYASGDEHPLAFLRTNVTLQQFDEFFDTFDIQEGDGMYIDPEKRVLVW